MRTIKELFLIRLKDGTILLTDKAKAYYAFILDYPDKMILHAVVNHSRADRNGFTWKLILDALDGAEFADERIVEVTQMHRFTVKELILSQFSIGKTF